jgi:hypothetical protein
LVTPRCFSFSSKKKKEKKKHSAVLKTALCSFFSPANAETGEKRIFEIFLPLALFFSLP